MKNPNTKKSCRSHIAQPIRSDRTAWLVCSIVSILFISCKHDTPLLPNNYSKMAANNCDYGMEYVAETTTLYKTVNPADVSKLTTLDKTLMLPIREKTMEVVCVRTDGTFYIEKEYFTPSNPIEYPAHTIGVWPKPQFKRLVNENGVVNYYNGANEIIDYGFTDSDQTRILDIVAMFQIIKNAPPLSNQDFNNFIAGLGANGMPFTDHGNNIITTKVTHNDGTSSVMVVNKNARMQVGQVDFDQNGNVCTSYMLKVSGQVPNVTFERLIEVTFYEAVESRVRMSETKTTVYQSFILNQ